MKIKRISGNATERHKRLFDKLSDKSENVCVYGIYFRYFITIHTYRCMLITTHLDGRIIEHTHRRKTSTPRYKRVIALDMVITNLQIAKRKKNPFNTTILKIV